MDFLQWTTFVQIVTRYDGDRGFGRSTAPSGYRAMAFAQLTCRESLREIETCLSVHAPKL